MGAGDKMLVVTCDRLASHPGGVAILLVASCYRNRDKLRQVGPVWPECGFTFTINEALVAGDRPQNGGFFSFLRSFGGVIRAITRQFSLFY